MLRNKRARAGSLQRRLTCGFGVAVGLLVATLTSPAQPLSSAEQASQAPPSNLTQSSGNGENSVAWLRYIASELRKLRVELLEDRWEIQQAKMQDLERELQIVQNQRHQLQAEQRAETLQVAEIEGLLAQVTLAKEEREELQSRRADLLDGASSSRFDSAQSALAQRETQVRERIALQQRRIQLLMQRAQELEPGKK